MKNQTVTDVKNLKFSVRVIASCLHGALSEIENLQFYLTTVAMVLAIFVFVYAFDKALHRYRVHQHDKEYKAYLSGIEKKYGIPFSKHTRVNGEPIPVLRPSRIPFHNPMEDCGIPPGCPGSDWSDKN